jgi:hypothetical protein
MPSKSEKQKKLMRAAAHNKEFADAAGIDQDVAKEFHEADKALEEKESVSEEHRSKDW